MKFAIPILLALGAIESAAYWWMHPTATGQAEPVLTYRPGIWDRGSKIADEATASASEALSNQKPVRRSPGEVGSSISSSPSPTYTLIPELVDRALPSLRCTTGTAARIDNPNGSVVFIAFFNWDRTTSSNVLEAFKHLPEECMGSIGMTLISKEQPRTYVVRDQESEDRGQPSPSPDQKSTIDNLSAVASAKEDPHSSISSSSPSSPNLHLLFDHTVFRDTDGTIVHAFKSTWVSGANTLIGEGIRGGGEQWRQIRTLAALKRFRPTHARVAQGAVRGIQNPEAAWQAFKQAMLEDLTFK